MQQVYMILMLALLEKIDNGNLKDISYTIDHFYFYLLRKLPLTNSLLHTSILLMYSVDAASDR